MRQLTPRPRTIALCVFSDRDKILAARLYDPTRDLVFYRPACGGIEFGERAEAAIAREIQEELGAEIKDPKLLGVLENIFMFDNKKGHEIVFVFDARFADESIYARGRIEGREDGIVIAPPGEEQSSPEAYTAEWVPLDYFKSAAEPLYPDGLLELLENGR